MKPARQFTSWFPLRYSTHEDRLRLLLRIDAVALGATPEAGTAATMVAEVSTMVTPSMLEDFREWRKNAKPEDREALEQWIAALIASLRHH